MDRIPMREGRAMNMSERTKLRWQQLARGLVLLLLLALTFVARCHNRDSVFHHNGVYFTDGDCYSRMTRAKMVTEGHWIIHHHDFENWPQGITPHTTAPLDWLIVGLKPVVDVVFKIGGERFAPEYRTQSLDVAGALISPLLGVLTAAWLWWWAGRMRVPYRAAMVLLFALSPMAVHGTVLGRPDHQSLLMFLLAVALGCELRLMRSEDDPRKVRRAWSIATVAAWGFALWVSLYEPLMLLLPVSITHLVLERKKLLASRRAKKLAALLGFLVLIFLVEGWRAEVPAPEMRASLARWSAGIGELRHLNPADALLWEWLGLLVVLAPVLLCLEAREDRRGLALLSGVVLLFGLTVWQLRWGYFLLLAFAMSVPWMLRAFRNTRVAWIAFAVGLLPIGMSWSRTLHPPAQAAEDMAWRQLSQARLRTIAATMKGGPRTGFLAPWWMSPQLAYWSGQPGIAGSSHQSLPGTLDTARFYVSADVASAGDILRKRQVGWVVADDASFDIEQRTRLLAVTNSELVLGVRAPEEPLAYILAEHPRQAPGYLSEVRPGELGLVLDFAPKEGRTVENQGMRIYATRMHRLYRVLPEAP
jgi:hypothetical protein